MNHIREHKIRFIYGIALSVLLLISAVCLIAGCCHIYSFGDDAFTYERIGRTFSYISVPVYVTLVALIGGVVVHFAIPGESVKLRAKRDELLILKRLSLSVPQLYSVPTSTVSRERRTRLILLYVNIAMYAVGIGLSLAFILNVGNYTKNDVNGSIVRMALVIFSCLIPPVIMNATRVFLNSASVARELASVREELKKRETDGTAEGSAASVKGAPLGERTRAMTAIRAAVALAGAVFLLVGIFSGGMGYVLSNAISICTGCIGLG